MDHRVAVVGGGWAGMAAAVTLAEQGVNVTVFEAARELGGRARRLHLHGVALDNGQHILIGAYAATLASMRRVGVEPDEALLRLPLELRYAGGFRLRAWPLPAPLHLACGLAGARGLPFSEALSAGRLLADLKRNGYRVPTGQTVAEWVREGKQGNTMVRRVWGPLCISALNTPMEQASAQVFANVLRDTLAGHRSASDLLLPRRDLGALFPQPAGSFVEARGGAIHRGTPVRAIVLEAGRFRIADHGAFDAVLVACGPQHAGSLLESLPGLDPLRRILERFTYEPITTCYLGYGADRTLPFPMLGFEDGPIHWLFDRGRLGGHRGVLAAVISASGGHESLDHASLARAVAGQIRARFPAFGDPVWSRVIAERRATFACRPGLRRPANDTPVPGLFLAGDYTASSYPGTLESAVRSGAAAAASALRSLRGRL